LLAGWVNAAEVVATRLDGRTISGSLKSWDNARAVIETEAGEQPVGADELLSLRWQRGAAVESADLERAGELELIDGTLLPIEEVEFRGAKAIFTPRRGSSASDKEVLPKKLVAAVRLQLLSPEAARQWQEIRHLDTASDILVVSKRDGQSLDYIECVIGEVTPDKITAELDGDQQSVDRKKVAGLVFYRRKSDAAPEARFAVKGSSGLSANVSSVRLTNSDIRLTTAAGAEIAWPLDDIYIADFAAGKLLYLSDMEPGSQEWTPLVALPSAAEVAARYGEPRRDQSAYGGSLTLLSDDASSSASTGAMKTYAKGLAIRSRTELVYRLPGGFRRLNAVAGIDPASSASGNVRLEIFGDDRLLLQTDVAGTDAPHDIDLDVEGIKRLRIVVDFGGNLDTGDWLNLCDARLVK
jgi:hypothetical protein